MKNFIRVDELLDVNANFMFGLSGRIVAINFKCITLSDFYIYKVST